MDLLLVLAFPFAGTLLLALLGARRFAAELNIGVSLATLIAAVMLALHVVSAGSLLLWHDQFFVDSFNIFMVVLTAFVGFTTALFSRPYMRVEQHHGRLNPLRLRLYHSMYQLFMAAMLLALLTNNMGLLWVAMEAATLSTVLLVSLYRTKASLEAAWKYFILCGVGIAQAMFGTILLYFAAEKILGRQGMTALLWTHLDAVKANLEPRVMGLAFVFLLIGYGTKVGLAPLHNWLPRCARGRACAGFRGSFRPFAQCSALRGHPLQSAGGRLDRQRASQPHADELRPAVRAARRIFSVAAARHQAALCLLVNRAHGHHYICIRARRSHCQLRRVAAHDRSFAHQILAVLQRRPRVADLGHAAHGWHTRPRRQQPRARMGIDARIDCHPGHAAFWRFHQRIPDSYVDSETASMGCSVAAAYTGRSVRRHLQQGATHGLWREFRAQVIAFTVSLSRLPSSGNGSGIGHLYSARAGRLVQRCCALDRVMPMTENLSKLVSKQIPGNVPAQCRAVNAGQWLATAETLRDAHARFLTLWGADDRDRDGRSHVYAAWLQPEGILVLDHAIEDAVNPQYPSLAELFPAASRMQRAVYDLLGISTIEPDTRGWLRHDGWPETFFPLRRDADGAREYTVASRPYPFVEVEGDGVHEIAVGPVHAGIIEPGHFRFSVVGEKVLRLEERLGYTHTGVAWRFEKMRLADGHRLAARVSGDSAVAFSWAWCAALESIAGSACPPRAVALRALALEHERLANHLGDLGALGNDAGFAFGLTQFSRLKEDLLRTNAKVFGARYLMDFVSPGGVAGDLPLEAADQLFTQYSKLEEIVADLRSIYDEHAGIQDRFRETGRLDREHAERLGALGLAARASGVPCDLRVDHPWHPYDKLQTRLAIQTAGDVAARVQVRFDEIFESIRLCRAILEDMPAGPLQSVLPEVEPYRMGIGVMEGWRGPVAIVLETGPEGTIRRCHAHDPSWQNWPLLEHAIIGNLVPDFPLINKSFNLSYSGQDG